MIQSSIYSFSPVKFSGLKQKFKPAKKSEYLVQKLACNRNDYERTKPVDQKESASFSTQTVHYDLRNLNKIKKNKERFFFETSRKVINIIESNIIESFSRKIKNDKDSLKEYQKRQ